MLSTNNTSSIQRRRTQHRRQNSTPAAFEAPQVRPLPANIQQQHRHQRSGMSLDLRGLNLETIRIPDQGPFPDPLNPGPLDTQYFKQEHVSTVSNTNIGQTQQHTMQVAHTHSQAQPGHQDTFLRSPVQQSLSSPRTPHRSLRGHSPQQPPLSPVKPPTEEQMKELQEHIQSVYGSYGQVFINILPTPTASPQKPVQLPTIEATTLPSNFSDMANINFEPTSSAMTFDFENPDNDMGYESSSYYTSDALSPSPMSSPRQKSVQMFLEKIEENPIQEMVFSQTGASFSSKSTSDTQNVLQFSMEESVSQSSASALAELEMDASIEYTGISPEEVQRYISEQDPTTNKWTCMYPDCGKTFGRRENIRSHVQTHLGDRQYRCNHCAKCFVRQHDLKRHAKIHSGTKPYKCPCSAEFARQDALTRHRQRGMCVGGFPDAVRRQAKRGRPKKNRPELEDRAEKANKTRRRLASAASSVSAGSPPSDTQSPPPSLAEYELLQSQDLPSLLPETTSFGDHMSSSTDPFSFETASSPYGDDANITHASFDNSNSFTGDVVSMNLFQQLSQTTTHTPPMSPADNRPFSSGSMSDSRVPVQPSPLKGSSTPSRSSIQSNPFSTPPTSPAEPKDDLDELFNSLPDSSCSQFDLEMKAMGEFSSLDVGSSYDFLDFTV